MQDLEPHNLHAHELVRFANYNILQAVNLRKCNALYLDRGQVTRGLRLTC